MVAVRVNRIVSVAHVAVVFERDAQALEPASGFSGEGLGPGQGLDPRSLIFVSDIGAVL